MLTLLCQFYFHFLDQALKTLMWKGKTRKLTKENEGNILMTPETRKDFLHKTEPEKH